MAERGRDQFNRLQCGFPKCRSVINGMTGLDEIHKLMAHVWRTHGRLIGMETAMQLRARWEEPEIAGADDRLAERGLSRKVEPETT